MRGFLTDVIPVGRAQVPLHVRMYVCGYVCMCVCIYVCIYVQY